MRTTILALFASCLAAAAFGGDFASAPARYAALDGARVHYRSLGEGRDAVVFVHGWASDLAVWREQVAAFGSRTRLIGIDLPGHGGSDKPDVRYTQELFARAIASVLRDAGVERAVLVGHSMGAIASRELLRIDATRVRGLVAVDGALWMPVENAPAVIAMAAPLKNPEFRENAEKFILGFMAGKLGEADRESIRRSIAATPQNVMVTAMESMGDPKIWKEERIDLPVLVINAKNAFWPADYEAKVRAFAPALEFHAIEGVGHYPMLERPDAVNPLLEEFFETCGVLPKQPS